MKYIILNNSDGEIYLDVITAEELQIEDKYIIEALTHAHRIRSDRYTILGKCGLTREEAEELAHASKVIH